MAVSFSPRELSFREKTREERTLYVYIYIYIYAYIYTHMCVCTCEMQRRGRIKGSKARDSRSEIFSFRFETRDRKGYARDQREGSQGAQQRFLVIFFSFSFRLFFFFIFLQCSQSTIFQFFRRCPLPWHRRLLSPPLCLLLRFRISVLAFGYLKKIQRKNIKRNSSQSRRCQISYHFVFFFFLSLFSFYNI